MDLYIKHKVKVDEEIGKVDSLFDVTSKSSKVLLTCINKFKLSVVPDGKGTFMHVEIQLIFIHTCCKNPQSRSIRAELYSSL